MHRLAALLALIPLPAFGWQFQPDPVCTIAHDAGHLRLVVTFDPALPEYAIALTLSDGTWPAAPAFHMAFAGERSLTIGTGRHTLSDGGRTLTVRDAGFGNVLDGLEFNARALAWSGERAERIALEGAAPAVRAFRACSEGGAMS